MHTKTVTTNPHPPTNSKEGWPGQLICEHCGQPFDRKPMGPAAKFGSLNCRVAHHRQQGKAAVNKAFKQHLRRKARR